MITVRWERAWMSSYELSDCFAEAPAVASGSLAVSRIFDSFKMAWRISAVILNSVVGG